MTTHKLPRPPNQPSQGDGSVNKTPPSRASDGPLKQEPPVIKLRLDSITVDADLQCRAAVDDDTVASYAERMKAGDKFPPLVVFEIEGAHVLVDGWHRHPAALKAGLAEFPVEVHRGTRNDALRYALQANATHGLPRTNRDKRRAVQVALRQFPDDSDHAIAEICKVSHMFVGKVRRQLETVSSSDTRLGRDGKKRKLPGKPSPGDLKARAASRGQSGEGGGQGEPTRAAQSKTGAQRRTPAAQTERGSGASSFWDEWSAIEDSLNAALKKWPDERWRRELASQLCKFADRRC